MARVIFVNRFCYPDHSATSQILTDIIFELAARGRQVSVVTSRQLYNDPDANLPQHESVRGVDIHRVSTTRFGRGTVPSRTADYASFYAAALRKVSQLAEPGDVLVAKTDPPLLSVGLMGVAKHRKAKLLNWLQDIYPEVASAVGVSFMDGKLGDVLRYPRDASLRAAAANVVIGEKMAEWVAARGVPTEQIRIIPNWADDKAIVPVAHKDNPLRTEWGFDDSFVVGYSGNLGRPHEYQTMLGAAETLRDRQEIAFLFIGGGHFLETVGKEAKERGLTNVHFRPYQPRDQLKISLSVPDVHWLSLRPALEGLIVPCKFYGILSAGRPVISVTDSDGEIARLVKRHDCGLNVEPGRVAQLASVISELAADPARCQELGAKARATMDAHFTRQRSFDRWASLLDELGVRSPSASSTSTRPPRAAV